jgi:hypothetical protein
MSRKFQHVARSPKPSAKNNEVAQLVERTHAALSSDLANALSAF